MTSVDVAHLVLRLSLGATITAHGINKIVGGGGLAGTASWFRSIGMRWPTAQARIAAVTEIASGLLLAVGLITPLSCAAIVALMLVAIVTVHRRVGFFIFLPGGGWEYCAIIAVSASTVALAGPGAISLDHVLGLGIGGWSSMTILAAGLILACAHLWISWHPDEKHDGTTIL